MQHASPALSSTPDSADTWGPVVLVLAGALPLLLPAIFVGIWAALGAL